MTFQIRLQKVLDERGLSQADLCRMTGLTTAGVSKYLTGQTKPTLEKAQLIAESLDMSLDELTGFKPKADVPPKQTMEVTTEEAELLRKFRAIDERGKMVVLRNLNSEYEIATATTANSSD